MKILIVVLALVTLSSCSSAPIGTMFSADTTKRFKCEGIVVSDHVMDHAFNDEKVDLEQIEKNTGYSECTYRKIDNENNIMECKKPFSYKVYNSKKVSNCQKFMIDNKLI
jgi:hypothetical protein